MQKKDGQLEAIQAEMRGHQDQAADAAAACESLSHEVCLFAGAYALLDHNNLSRLCMPHHPWACNISLMQDLVSEIDC